MEFLWQFLSNRILSFDATNFIGTVLISIVARTAWTRRIPSLRWPILMLAGLLFIQFYLQPLYIEYHAKSREQQYVGVDESKVCRHALKSDHFHTACVVGDAILNTSPLLVAHQKVMGQIGRHINDLAMTWWIFVAVVLVCVVLFVAGLSIGVRRYEQGGIKRYGRARYETLVSRAAAAACHDPCGGGDDGPEDF